MRQILDTHVHFWEPRRLRYPWLDALPALNRTFLPDHVPAQVSTGRIEALVFVQADCAAEQAMQEVEWVTELARSDARIGGIVAFAPLEAGEAVQPILEQLVRFPLVKGVRRLLQSEPPGFGVQPGFVAGARMLARHGLSCDLCIRHTQLADVIELVRLCPEVNFVLDHIGKPDIKARRLEPWRGQINALASLPNVMCKLSGLVTEADGPRWQVDDLRPYADQALSAFGPERVMFGSDAPVLTLAATYERWFDAAVELTHALSASEQENLFYRNGARFYRLAPRGGNST